VNYRRRTDAFCALMPCTLTRLKPGAMLGELGKPTVLQTPGASALTCANVKASRYFATYGHSPHGPL
jgi:hypothetical protein